MGAPPERKAEINLRAIPLLAAGGWTLFGPEEWMLSGAVPKGVLAFGDPADRSTVAYIAKRGRKPDARIRECVTEEMISKVGRLLPLRVAKSRLVRLPVPPGEPPDVRFMSRNFLRRPGEALIHGLELWAQYMGATSDELVTAFNLADKKEERRFYTVDLMMDVLRWWGRDESERASLQSAFGRLLAFDALVGAQDRHGMNWGVIEDTVDPTRTRSFAPAFDTARGLLWDHSEERLEGLRSTGKLDEHVKWYANKSSPVLGCQGSSTATHFQLIEYMLCNLPELRGSVSQVVRAFRLDAVRQELERTAGRIISALRMASVLHLLGYRHTTLLRLIDNRKGP